MAHKPKIPMRPEDVPQQRVHLVVQLPPRPPSFQGYCDFVDPMPDDVRPKGSPRNIQYLGSVEWAWGPMNSRLDSYYLNPRRSQWLLWVRYRDENDWKLRWAWILYAYGPRRGVTAKDAAIYLLMDAWSAEAQKSQLDHYGWINQPGLLSVEEISAIARAVWSENSDVQ